MNIIGFMNNVRLRNSERWKKKHVQPMRQDCIIHFWVTEFQLTRASFGLLSHNLILYWLLIRLREVNLLDTEDTFFSINWYLHHESCTWQTRVLTLNVANFELLGPLRKYIFTRNNYYPGKIRTLCWGQTGTSAAGDLRLLSLNRVVWWKYGIHVNKRGERHWKIM